MSSWSSNSRPTTVALFVLLLASSESLVTALPLAFEHHSSESHRSSIRAPQQQTAAASTTPAETSKGLSHQTLLIAQICGVAGGYIVPAAIFGILLLTVGKRLRKAAQAGAGTLAIEMMKPAQVSAPAPAPLKPEPTINTRSLGPQPPLSPVSPSRSWFKPFKRGSGSTTAAGSMQSPPLSPKSPGIESITSFDQRVVDADKERRQQEMDRLYAAVMEHDKKQSKVVFENVPANSSSEDDITPTSPRTNSFRPIYPPPSLSVNTQSAQRPARQVGLPASPRSPQLPASPRSTRSQHSLAAPSFDSSITANTASSPNSKKTRKGLKNLRISAPMKNYPGTGSPDEEARTPLSPRMWNNLPPPPEPPSATTLHPQTPASPATPYANGQGHGQTYGVTPASPLDAPRDYQQFDGPRALPHPAPQRAGSSTVSLNATVASYHNTPVNANSSSGALPLRDAAYTVGSPPPTKTTYVQPRVDAIARMAKRTGGLTPATGVPMTPYSPYMPFTPITPVTPHLVTKQERRIRKKEEGRKLATMDEMVKSPQEMWDDAY